MLKNKLFLAIGALALLAFAATGGAWIYLNNQNGADSKASVLVASVTYPTVTSCSASKTTLSTNEQVTFTLNYANPGYAGFTGYDDAFIEIDYNDGTSPYEESFAMDVVPSGTIIQTHYYYSTGTFQPRYGIRFRNTGETNPYDQPYTFYNCGSPITVVGPLTAPAITAPSYNQTFTNLASSAYITLSWTPVSGANSYSIQMLCSGTGSCGVADWTYGSDTNSLQFPVNLASGTYNFSFRVRAYRASDGSTGPWSNYQNFTLVKTAALSAPNLMNPASNAVFTKVNSVSMSWGTVSGATKYQVQVDCDSCTSTWGMWSDNIVYQNYYEIALTNSVMANTNHQMRFKVRAGDNLNNYSAWSTYGYFTVNNASTTTTTTPSTTTTTISTPAITYPAQNALLTPTSTGARKVTLKWNAVAQPISYYELEFLCSTCTGASIKNGTSTSYAYTAPDNNQVRFRVRAVDGNGNSSNWSDYRDFNFKATSTTTTTTTTQTRTYSDMDQALYRDAITFLSGRGILSGYADGTFKPLNTVNRAELLKTVIQAAISANVITPVMLDSFAGQQCFSDTSANEWYTKYVCYAKTYYIVSGYEDGTFKPAQTVSMAEAFKIALKTFNFTYPYKDPWYVGINETVQSKNLFPERNDQPHLTPMRRDMVAELVARMVLNQEGKLESYISNPGSVK